MEIKVGPIRKPKPDEIIGVRVLNAGLHAYQTVINLEDVLSQITDYTTKQHIRSVISANKTFLNHTFFSAKLPKKEQEEMQETIEEASAGINAIMLIFRDLGTEAKTVLLNIANAMAYDGADAKMIEEVLSGEKPAQFCKNCKSFPVQSIEQHLNCTGCYFVGNQQSNFEQK